MNVVLALFPLASFFVWSCVTTPVTNRQSVRLLPESQLNSMGVQAYKEMLQKEKESADPRYNEMVRRIGQRIATVSGKNYQWEFKVIDNSQMVNAFCLPGGKVAVYTGILPVAKNEAGLAAVMGHEVAHAILQHGNERVSQQLLIQAGLVVTAISLNNNKYRNLILGGLGVGSTIGVALPFSRMHESEADRVGTEYMARAGYDPREAVELWHRMGAQGGGKMPQFLSTHPDPTKRAQDLSKRMGEMIPLYEASAAKQASTPI